MPGYDRCRLAPWIVVIMGLAGCRGADELRLTALPECAETAIAPELTLVDSLQLHESDSLNLGNPAVRFYSGPSGLTYIPDRGNNRIVVVSPSGAISQVVGRHGAGPGEFTGIGYVGLITDGMLWQTDYRLRRISIFDSTGHPIRELPFEGRLTSLRAAGNRIWAGIADHQRGFAIAAIDPDEPRDSIRGEMIALPAEYREYPLLALWDHVETVAAEDTLIVAFGGLDYIVRYDMTGTPRDTVWIPACRRQGAPKDILERGFRHGARSAGEQEELEQLQTRISGLLGLWRLSNDTYLIWYQDPRREPSRILRSTGYLTVLSSDLTRACVDAPLTAPGSGRAILSVANDHVLLLDQVVDDGPAPPTVRTVSRRYRINTENCTWLPTTPEALSQ